MYNYCQGIADGFLLIYGRIRRNFLIFAKNDPLFGHKNNHMVVKNIKTLFKSGIEVYLSESNQFQRELTDDY